MSDINEPIIDTLSFYRFANRMIISGRCAKRNCPDHDHSVGPMIGKPGCVRCWRESSEGGKK